MIGPAVFRGPEASSGGEHYSAWFADERDGIVYFGLSDFWSAFWATGDPMAELRMPGAQVIGRFDLASESFLPPLVVRGAGPDARASIWDVLAHPNGWVYFTTFYEQMGRVNPATGEVEHFPALGRGLNELALGAAGQIYATRYGAGVDDPLRRGDGALVVFEASGLKLTEVRLHARDGGVTAAKSVAFDPRSRHTFVNADVILDDGSVEFARFEFDPNLSLVSAATGDPELQFIAFASDGRQIAVEDQAGRLRLSLRDSEGVSRVLDLGPRDPLDFAQDVHFTSRGTAAVAFWSGRIEFVSERLGSLAHARLELDKPADCVPPAGRSLVYSAFVASGSVYATLYCGATIVRQALPADWKPIAPGR